LNLTTIILQSGGLGSKLGDIVLSADWFAKLIFLLLLLISVISWGITLSKLKSFKRIQQESKKFMSTYGRKRILSEAYPAISTLHWTPLTRLFLEGYKKMSDYSESESILAKAGNPAVALTTEAIEDIKATLVRVTNEETEKLEKGVAFLATTANVSPFLGLLGTVWGVMISFQDIGVRGSASLAVVAPGIATALIATIFGLAAAIPAVVAYNYCNRRIRNFVVMQENFSSQLVSDVRREFLL
jgi:biopolymer transport protein TolQ